MAAPGIAHVATGRAGRLVGGRGDRSAPRALPARVGASTRAPVRELRDGDRAGEGRPAEGVPSGSSRTPGPPDGCPAPGPVVPCRVHDPDLWFAERPVHLERAKQLCGTCPIRSACLDGALARAEPWGVWGGQIVENGVVRASKRGRGRPPKNPRPAGSGDGA